MNVLSIDKFDLMLGDNELHDFKEVGSIAQDINEYENYSIKAYDINGIVVVIINLINDTKYYTAENDEIPSIDDADAIKSFLQSVAADCAGNSDDPMLEGYAWGIASLTDDSVVDDFVGDCAIIEEQNFYGPYSPLSWITASGEKSCCGNHVFASAIEAQAVIDELESGTYYEAHNEAGRPTYYIVAI